MTGRSRCEPEGGGTPMCSCAPVGAQRKALCSRTFLILWPGLPSTSAHVQHRPHTKAPGTHTPHGGCRPWGVHPNSADHTAQAETCAQNPAQPQEGHRLCCPQSCRAAAEPPGQREWAQVGSARCKGTKRGHCRDGLGTGVLEGSWLEPRGGQGWGRGAGGASTPGPRPHRQPRLALQRLLMPDVLKHTGGGGGGLQAGLPLAH